MKSKMEIKFAKGIPKRREKILTAAAMIFTEKGIDNTTIDEIAARAGVGKGTIYRQIGNKKNIVELLFKEGIRLSIEAIEKETGKRTDPLLQFKEAIYALCEVYEKYSELAILLFEQIEQISSCSKSICGGGLENSPVLGKEIARLMGLIENTLKKAVKKNQIKNIDTNAISMGLFHFLDPHFYWYLRNERNYTRGEIAEFVINIFLNGLKPKK